MSTSTAALATPAEVARLLRWSKVIALDLETTGLNPRRDRIRLLSVSNGPETLVMDCFEHPVAQVLPLLPTKILVAHNAAFDLGFLWAAGMRDLPETICTFLVAQMLTAGAYYPTEAWAKQCGLAACCKRWLGQELPKDLQASDWSGPLSAAQIEYARRDAAVLPRLHQVLAGEVEKAKLTKAVDVELRALRPFVWMAATGIPFNRPAWQKLADQAAEETAECEARLNKIAPPRGDAGLFGHVQSWDWSSPKQVGEVLGMLGVPVPSTNDYHLSEIKHPIGEVLRNYRGASKRVSTYGHDWLNHVAGDGRVYPSWWQLGTVTGRTSCKAPNMQQLPREGVYRSCVPAPPGLTLIKADYGQLQMRIAAKFARDKALLDVFRSKGDVHTATAQALLGKEEVSKQDRQIAKSANFALLFGAGARGLQAYAKATFGLDMTIEQAERHRAKFFERYSGLGSWHRQAFRNSGKETRSSMGRRRFLHAEASPTLALNSPVQSEESDGIKLAFALLWERRQKAPDARPILFVHDEIVVECPTDQAEHVRAWVSDAMHEAMAPLLDPVPVEVDASIKPTWGG